MKKLLIASCLILSFCLLFILLKPNKYIEQNNPIPKHLSTQYKTEIEKIIDMEYPLVIKKIDNLAKDAEELKNKLPNNKVVKNNNFQQEYTNLCLIAEICIPATDLDLYAKIMQITQEKYLNIEYKPFATDNPSAFKDYLHPYFINNNVNQNKLESISKYANKKISVIEKYCTEIGKMQGY